MSNVRSKVSLHPQSFLLKHQSPVSPTIRGKRELLSSQVILLNKSKSTKKAVFFCTPKSLQTASTLTSQLFKKVKLNHTQGTSERKKLNHKLASSTSLSKSISSTIPKNSQMNKSVNSIFFENYHKPCTFNESLPKDFQNISVMNLDKSSIKIAKKEFDKYFAMLDSNNSSRLNYSRFSILLQSMNFIKNPQRKSYEERELILQAWKLIGGDTHKMITKGNALVLCLAILNVHEKFMPTHKFPVGLGKIINKIYCVRKEEIKNIHKKFKKFCENRQNNLDSQSPSCRNILRKNLSFEMRPNSGSPVGALLNTQTTPESVKILNCSNVEKITHRKPYLQESIIEEDTDSFLKLLKTSSGVIESHRPEIIEQEIDNSINQTVGNIRLSLRLTTQIMKLSKGHEFVNKGHRSNRSNRSLTHIQKSENIFDSPRNNDESIPERVNAMRIE